MVIPSNTPSKCHKKLVEGFHDVGIKALLVLSSKMKRKMALVPDGHRTTTKQNPMFTTNKSLVVASLKNDSSRSCKKYLELLSSRRVDIGKLRA
jgi:hypothetical protein